MWLTYCVLDTISGAGDTLMKTCFYPQGTLSLVEELPLIFKKCFGLGKERHKSNILRLCPNECLSSVDMQEVSLNVWPVSLIPGTG